ncbi:MAG TPA: hypothetical protein VKR61_23075 [Bryobacteraceae bacterium]|nr:hypothetical protein [Bryobacteraceae bacterium]
MRRVPALLLLSAFSLALIGPVFSADADADLPACCRRDGKHHCAMMTAEPVSSGVTVKAAAAKCPFFPKGGAVLPHSGAAMISGARPAGEPIPSHTAAVVRAIAGYSFRSNRSHQKRGPPNLLSI